MKIYITLESKIDFSNQNERLESQYYNNLNTTNVFENYWSQTCDEIVTVMLTYWQKGSAMALNAADWGLARSGVQVRLSRTKEALMMVFTTKHS